MKARIALDLRTSDINDEGQASVNRNVHPGGVGNVFDVGLWPGSGQRRTTAALTESPPAKNRRDAKETSH